MAYRPAQVNQLDGSQYQGLNCTCAVGAMALDRTTLGGKRSTGAVIRQATGDTKGGTTQRQVADAIFNKWSVMLQVNTPFPIDQAWKYLDEGQGIMLAGQASATRGTKWQADENFGGNHQWFDNERRKNSQVAGGYEHLIFDPLADGRRPGIAKSPFWIPEAYVHQFTSRLNVAANPASNYVALGLNQVYAAFTRDTEPYLWGSDVSPSIRHVNQDGRFVAGILNNLTTLTHSGDSFGSVINIGDLVTGFTRARHVDPHAPTYGTVVQAAKVQALIDWWKARVK